MTALALICFGTITILAGLALVAITPALERHAVILPIIRTTALLLTAAIYVAALFDGELL